MLESADAARQFADEPVPESHRRILATAAFLGLATILVKLVAFGKDLLVADLLGAGDELDAYLIAFLAPSFAVAVLAQSGATALLPVYVRVREQEGPQAARRLLVAVLIWGGTLLAAVAMVLAIVAPLFFPILGLGFDGAKLALAERLFYVMSAILVASGLSAALAAALNAEDHFGATALAPVAVPIGTLALFWMLAQRFGVMALAIGTLVGFLAECGILFLAATRRGLLGARPAAVPGQALRDVARQYWPLVAGALLMSGSTVVDQAMAASLGSGSVSVLNYGNKVVALVLSIVAVSLSTVLFPRFSRLVAAGRLDQVVATLSLYARLVIGLSVPIVALLIAVSEPIVRLLFERGAFTAEAVVAAGQVQSCLALQIPFYILNMIGIRVLSALGSNRTLLRIAALNLAINIVGDYVLMQWYGVNGIAISTAIVYLVAATVTFIAIRVKLRDGQAAMRAT